MVSKRSGGSKKGKKNGSHYMHQAPSASNIDDDELKTSYIEKNSLAIQLNAIERNVLMVHVLLFVSSFLFHL